MSFQILLRSLGSFVQRFYSISSFASLLFPPPPLIVCLSLAPHFPPDHISSYRYKISLNPQWLAEYLAYVEYSVNFLSKEIVKD